MMRSAAVGFDHFGAGNIGDDVTLAGLLEALRLLRKSPLEIHAASAFDIESQRSRFPQVRWRAVARDPDAPFPFPGPLADAWIGAGSTVFQLTCGTYILDSLTKHLDAITGFRFKSLVCAGAESEILPRAADFSAVARVFDRISTRDAHTYRVFSEMLGAPAGKLFRAADLANVAMDALKEGPFPEPEFDVGVILAGDTLDEEEIREAASFIASAPATVAFVANDVRKIPKHECGIYAGMTRFPWSRVRRRSVLLVPDFRSPSVAGLLEPIARCRTVISSRYHGVLIAAWLGKRVAAVNRSSKLTALSSEWGIPSCARPLTAAKLRALAAAAAPVPARLLRAEADLALEGVRFAMEPFLK